MGEQPDPEMDVAIGRGTPRIYDGNAPLTEEEAEQLRQWHKERDARSAAYTGKRGSHTLTGGGLCVCGRCLWESKCPGVRP